MSRTKFAVLAGTALSLGCVQSANAQAPIPFSWAGLYIGVNIGGSWGTAKSTVDAGPFQITTPDTFHFPGGVDSPASRPDGVIGGAQFGYNFLISPIWLVGFETDIQGSSQKGSGLSGFAGFVPNGTGCTTTICEYSDLTDITAKLTWFGTVRGRTGVIWNNILFYGTFGLAYGEIKISGTNVFAAQFLHSGNSVTYVTPLDYSKIATGIAGGGGIEGQLALPGWIWRLEYLHLDFGSVDGNFVGLPPITVSTKVTDEIVRIAFSYQLSGMP